MQGLKWLLVVMVMSSVTLVAQPASQFYEQHNLVTNKTDSDLVNPWGLVSSAGSPWWVADNGTSKSTLYNAEGEKRPLVVSLPDSAPTGIVFNGNSGAFLLDPYGKTGAAVFLFVDEGGTLWGWNGSIDPTHAVIVLTTPDAVYKGLAVGTTGSGDRLYATNFRNGTVDVFDATFAPINGGFQDSTIPAGYAPFGIQTIGSVVYVTYALQDEHKEDDVPGEGHGFVNAFTTEGQLIGRVASGGPLNSPWGIAWAPEEFGRFANHLLIGNFGSGRILAYDPSKQLGTGLYQLKGQLHGADGKPISIDGLWAIQFGHGNANSGDEDELYFTAGPNDETGGLFGYLEPTGAPGRGSDEEESD
jgi:uncharacterized protein (TIGR03118 family)